MNSFPNRCQHIKVNGTQCGCPALRRNKLCYFHKRHHDERLELQFNRLKQDQLNLARFKAGLDPLRPATLQLPVLEDANSIQVSLMQIMRLLLASQIDPKTAGLLLYALQTASVNLQRTNFEPQRHTVVLDPGAVSETPLGAHIWDDSDFEEDEEEEAEEEDEETEGEESEAEPEVEEIEPAKVAKGIPKRPAAKVAGKIKASEVREQIRNQIRAAVPELLAANPDARFPGCEQWEKPSKPKPPG